MNYGGYGPGFGWGNGGQGGYNNGGFGGNRYADAYGEYRGGYGGLPPPGPYELGFAPPMRRTPFMRRGQDPGPPTRQNDSAIKYLIRCGVPRENLKGLPRDLLDLILPEHCGLCGQDFDSFSISRVHYLSKNHLKNQKKWLNNASQRGAGTETPLKARELYCELCDVQITSKVHADSHYSGKSHRAVVIGRKNPKNPVLLQPGMERRLQQLIRREKKFIKDVPEEDPEKPQDNKPVSPELYCEICKTSVTCSEQMTAHMNGKRHLTKEKQFILKQMRGDTGDDEDEENEDEEEGDEEHVEGEEEEGAEGEGVEANAETGTGQSSGVVDPAYGAEGEGHVEGEGEGYAEGGEEYAEGGEEYVEGTDGNATYDNGNATAAQAGGEKGKEQEWNEDWH